MKLPNKTGTVCRLTGKRSRPYMARIYTQTGYKVLGYYRLKSEAVTAVINATAKTPPAQSPVMSLDEVFNLWAFKHSTEVTEPTMQSYRNAYRIIQPLQNRPIRYITATDIEQQVLFVNPPRTVRIILKTLLKLVYQYAEAHDMTDRNIADLIDIRMRDDSTERLVRKPFTYAEVSDLFSDHHYLAPVVLIGIFTGMRPGELLNLRVSEVDLPNQMLHIAGSKTKSGKNRSIPIHPAILSTVTDLCLKAANSGSEWICTKNNGKAISIGSLATFTRHYGHTPHDIRHTFATFAHQSGMDSLATKRIMGHVVKDLTESVYTHTNEAYLTAEMRKFRIL